MGACTFYTRTKGANAKEAFAEARRRAEHDCGYGGYSGTIAEKRTYTLIPLPSDVLDPALYARALIEARERRVDDKWGSAGCIKLQEGECLFFGWASE